MVIFFVRKTDNCPSVSNCPYLHYSHLSSTTGGGSGICAAFYALMGFLSLNLIICSINRFPISLKQYKAPYFPEPTGIFDNIPQNQMIIADKKKTTVSPIIESCLKAKYGSVRKIDTQKGHVFYDERGRFSLFGVYAVHLSILLMIAGAVIGCIFGLQADINIKEGETVNVVNLAEGKGIHQLDFSVRCDKFIADFYENGAPKTYRSDLSFIKNGKVAHQGSLLVNHPITFEGLRFYQSSYSTSPEIKAIITYTISHKKSREIVLAAGDTLDLPESKAKAVVLRVEENIMELGPAVKLRITSPQKDVQFRRDQNSKSRPVIASTYFQSWPFQTFSVFP